MANHREFKDALYAQFARIGHALASPKRMELLDLLGQGEKSVEALAEYVAMPIKNTSAHLRVLRQARLVETRRDGTYVYYRLANDDVFPLLRTIETLAHSRLADVQQVVQAYLDGHDDLEPVTFQELRRLMREEAVTLVDVRPADEYAAGHIRRALGAGRRAETPAAGILEAPRDHRVLPRAVLRVFARRGAVAPQAGVSRPARP